MTTNPIAYALTSDPTGSGIIDSDMIDGDHDVISDHRRRSGYTARITGSPANNQKEHKRMFGLKQPKPNAQERRAKALADLDDAIATLGSFVDPLILADKLEAYASRLRRQDAVTRPWAGHTPPIERASKEPSAAEVEKLRREAELDFPNPTAR